jgi:hypothetical protein
MLNTKCLLLTVNILVLGAASAQADDQILRRANGSILFMTQYEASGVDPVTKIKVRPDACEAAGKGRLPTIRELAQEAQTLGAKGVLEVNQVDPNNVPAGYYLVSAINPDRQKDEFYFNHDGYQRPSGDLGAHLFWLASVHPHISALGFYFSGPYGGVYSRYRDDFYVVGVRCIGL